MKRNPPYVHPDRPIPRPVHLLWRVLDELQYPYLKLVWVGEHMSLNWGYYIPAIVSYRPGIQHRLAVDFVGYDGKWVAGNRNRSRKCAKLGIEYMTIKRTDTYAEMMAAVGATIQQLRENTEYTPNEQR